MTPSVPPDDKLPTERIDDPTLDTTAPPPTLTESVTAPIKNAAAAVVAQMPAPVTQAAIAVSDAVKVTSSGGKANWRDRVVAWTSSFCITVLGLVLPLWKVLASLLESVTDYVVPYLQTNLGQQTNTPLVAAVAFVVIGFLILNKRRAVGASYQPPMAAWGGYMPVPQVPPLPPGAPVYPTKSAF
jgi:hypothetical protein